MIDFLKDTATRKSIIASVIASLIVIIFIQPILKYIWGAMIWISDLTYSGAIDSIYRNVAIGDRNWVVAMFAVAILSMPSLITFFYFTRKFYRKFVVNKDIKPPKTKNAIFYLVPIIFIISSLYLALTVFMDIQINARFNQRIHALSPYLQGIEIKNLRSDWALMKSRDDFIEIENKIQEYAKQHGVDLPDIYF